MTSEYAISGQRTVRHSVEHHGAQERPLPRQQVRRRRPRRRLTAGHHVARQPQELLQTSPEQVANPGTTLTAMYSL